MKKGGKGEKGGEKGNEKRKNKGNSITACFFAPPQDITKKKATGYFKMTFMGMKLIERGGSCEGYISTSVCAQ